MSDIASAMHDAAAGVVPALPIVEPSPFSESVSRQLDALSHIPSGYRGRLDVDAGRDGARGELSTRVGAHGTIAAYGALSWNKPRAVTGGVRGSFRW